MKRILLPIGLIALSAALSTAKAQTAGTPTPFPSQAAPAVSPVTTPVSNEAVTTSPAENNETPAADEEDQGNGEKPFAPHWTGQLGFTYSNQPNAQGQGQTSGEFSFTGTYNINENNAYFSLELTGGQQTLEGANTNYGSLTAEGAWGFGFFQPSLSVAQQQGAAALNSTTATLNLNFQWLDLLSAGMLGSAGLESHQGPVSTFSPLASRGDTLEEGDSYNWVWGFQAGFEPWDYLSFSLTAEREYDTTYQFQNIYHTAVFPTSNQYDRIDSLTLGGDLTFWRDYALDLSIQLGREYQPAGVFYSPVLRKTVFNPNQTEQGFTAFTAGLMYNFQ